MRKYVLADKDTGLHIKVIGVCTSFDSKRKAEDAAEKWNKTPEWLRCCKVKVVCVNSK